MTGARQKRTRREWEERASSLQPRTQAFVDGRFVPAASGETFADPSPRDGAVLAIDLG